MSESSSTSWERCVDFGATVMSCRAGWGAGGTGLHFSQIGEDLRRRGQLVRCYAGAGASPDALPPPGEIVLPDPSFARAARFTPLRFSRSWLSHLGSHRHDLAVARELERCRSPIATTFIGFNGQSLRSFQAARRRGFRQIVLVSATSHVRNVQRRHAEALARYPIDRSWLNEWQISKTLAEYDMADLIIVGSEYTRRSMLAEGIASAKLVKFRYFAHQRFAADLIARTERPRDPACNETRDTVHDVTGDTVRNPARFRIVYCGAVTPMKGAGVLIDAFARFDRAGAELIIVGGTGSRSMRKYITAAIRRDPRIRLAPGDPLPVLRGADVCVHASFDDGFGYAPIEAIACGVPVIVTDATGMSERVREGENGYIVPAGQVEPIVQRLEQIHDACVRPAAVSAELAAT